MSSVQHTTLARLHATSVGAPLPPRPALPSRAGAERGDVASDAIASLEGDQRFMHIFTTSGPQAPSLLRAPASAWQAAGVGQFDGMCFNIGAQRSDGVNTVMPGAFAMDGTLGVAGDFVHALPTGELTAGPLLGLWTDQVWAGGGIGYVDAAAHVGVRLGFMASGHVHNGVDVSLPGLPKGQKAKSADVHVEEHRYWQMAWMPAVALFNWLRVLCRIDRISACDTVYDAKVDLASAALLNVESTSAFGRWIVGTWRGLWGFHPLPIPALEHPERLREKEVRRTTFDVRRNYLGSLGAFLVYGGYQRSTVHQSEISAERLDADTVQITWTQTQIGSDQGFGVVPGGVSADWGRHKPVVKTVSFPMRLDRDSLAAYRTFVDVLKHKKTAAEEDKAFEALLGNAAFKNALQEQPKITVTTGKTRGGEVGARMYLFPSTFWDWVLPKGFAAGFSTGTERRAFTHTAGTMGDAPHTHLDIVCNQRQNKRGPAGKRQNIVLAVVEEKRAKGVVQDVSVVVGSSIKLSRADASEVQRYIINPLNNHFDAHLAPLQGAGWRVSRDVTLERRVERADLARLAALTAADQDAIGAQSGVQVKKLNALVQGLAKLPSLVDAPVQDVQAACVLVQKFVDEAGLPGLGALRHALGPASEEDQRWSVKHQSGAYNDADAPLGALRTRTLDPKQPATRGFRKASAKIDRFLQASGRMAHADPFVDGDDREGVAKMLQEKQDELATLRAPPADEKVAAETPTRAAARLALDVQRFLRTHSEPRFGDAEANQKAMEACAKLRTRLADETHDGALDALLAPWSAVAA